jgi:hypothetical protein
VSMSIKGAPRRLGSIHVEMAACAIADVLLCFSRFIVMKESNQFIDFNLMPCVVEGSFSNCCPMQGVLSN